MLAIIFLLGAARLHAIPRGGQVSSTMRLPPGRALLGASSASWPRLGGVAASIDGHQPFLAHHAMLPHTARGVAADNYLALPFAHAKPWVVSARPFAASRASRLSPCAVAGSINGLQPLLAHSSLMPHLPCGVADDNYYTPPLALAGPWTWPARPSSCASLVPLGVDRLRLLSLGLAVPQQHPMAPGDGVLKLWPTLMVASYTSSITSTSTYVSAESSIAGGCSAGVCGSFGSLAWLRSLIIGGPCSFGSSLTFPHTRCFLFAGVWPSHWLCHFDYDLEFRRRVSYAFVPYHSKALWSGLVQKTVQSWASVTYNVNVALIFGAHAFTSALVAFESPLSSNSLLVALVSSMTFVLNLVGVDGFMALCSSTVSFVLEERVSLVRLRVFSPLLFWVLLFSNFSVGSSVCLSCSGNDPNCKGDNTCVLAMALAANALVMAGSVSAAKSLTMGDDGKHILPLTWLQVLKPSVLQTLVSLARRAPSGTPLDLSSLTIQALSAQISNGSLSISEGRLEFLRRMSADGVSDADLLKMKTICEVLPQRGDDRFQSPLTKLSNSGALQFVFALACQIVLKLSGSSKLSLTLGGEASSSSSSASVSIELKRPQSSDAFFHSLTVWQSLLCATGLSNSVVTGPFISEVVHEIVPARGWRVALEHFLSYISKIDSGCGWQLATATSMGSHDTFMHKAIRAAGEEGKLVPTPTPKPSPPEKLLAKPAFSGKFNSDSLRTCPAFNFAQDHKSLKPDGSCPFNHACDQWVSDKGKGGRCMGAHSRVSCTNPSKCASKLE